MLFYTSNTVGVSIGTLVLGLKISESRIPQTHGLAVFDRPEQQLSPRCTGFWRTDRSVYSLLCATCTLHAISFNDNMFTINEWASVQNVPFVVSRQVQTRVSPRSENHITFLGRTAYRSGSGGKKTIGSRAVTKRQRGARLDGPVGRGLNRFEFRSWFYSASKSQLWRFIVPRARWHHYGLSPTYRVYYYCKTFRCLVLYRIAYYTRVVNGFFLSSNVVYT